MIMITGASSGLGAALAFEYAKDNAHLFLTGRNTRRLQQIATQLTSHQAVHTYTADLSHYEDIAQLFDALPCMPTCLIHCAGSGLFGPIETQDPTQIKQLIDDNVTACIYVIQEAIKRFKDKPMTLAIVMSSAANTAKTNESTYCAVKWAIKGFLNALKLELKTSPIKIVAVYPGGMNTDFWSTSGTHLNTSAFMEASEAASMLKQALLSTEKGYISEISIDRG
ncbi:SDR family NAD(P)-dependent oxidoreductase [uncultured Shewanella sp.]|uniref:SDR family NAD(P)-dependent oxidoreductase n=1 Tax=uncultured Shewanella sp. TaxID=173975 RepID=UPI0026306CED|nr:SDR family NAD(P)-dependent oxidoreductase [uncultured Shewanella sp.]